MGLFSPAVLQQINAAALQAQLAGKRSQLFLGIDEQIKAQIEQGQQDAEQLAIDLTKLNDYQEASSDGFLLAIWLSNAVSITTPTHPTISANFQRWLDEVRALQPQAPALNAATAAGVVVNLQSEAAASTAVEAQVDLIRAFIAGLADRANELKIAKSLHDSLHQIQRFLPVLRQKPGLPKEGWALFAGPVVENLKNIAATMPSLVSGLPAGHELGDVASEMISRLRNRLADFEAFVSSGTGDEAQASLLKLRREIRGQMGDLADRIDAGVKSLQLDQLIGAFEKISARLDPGNKVARALGEATGSLTIIMQNLSVLGKQHKGWQDLDQILWTLEDAFDLMSNVPFFRDSFAEDWKRADDMLVKLAGDPPVEWYVKNKPTVDAFVAVFPLPVKVPIDAKADGLFQSFVGVNREEFYKVDKDMLSTCERLGSITAQLRNL